MATGTFMNESFCRARVLNLLSCLFCCLRLHVKWNLNVLAVPKYIYPAVYVLKLYHCAKKPVTTMLTYPWKCTVLHCNHLGNTWKPLVLMTRHFDYYPSASEGDNQSVRSSAPVVSRCFPGDYNVKLYISRGRLAWWLLAFLCCVPVADRKWGQIFATVLLTAILPSPLRPTGATKWVC